MWVKILLLFFVFSFLFRSDHSLDQDLGRHIKLGEIIWNTKQVPTTNLFSYTNSDFPFINTHWLFEVLAYFFSRTIGIYALLILKIIIILLSVWLIVKTIPKKNQLLLLPIGFIFFHVLRERLELRPEIFSFLFTALTLFILNRFNQMSADRGTFDKNKSIFLLPVIQLLWINTHIYFFIGLILQAIYIIDIGYHQLHTQASPGRLKILLLVFVLSATVSLINPNGLSGVFYPLNVTENYGYTIAENQTIFLLESIGFTNPNFIFVKFAVGICALSVLVAFLRRKFEPVNILLVVLPVSLALMNVRSFPYLVFLALPSVLANFGLTKFKLFPPLSAAICILLFLESFFYLNGAYYKYTDNQHQPGVTLVESARGAMDFVIQNDLPAPIYNNFDIGSYIIYRGYLPAGRQGPKYRVFVDGRPEGYPKEFFQDIYIPAQSDYSKFKALGEKYQFKTVLFSHTDQTPWAKIFLQEIFKDQPWKLVYVDNFMVVLVKGEILKEKNLAEVDLSKLSPREYNFKNHRDYLQLGLFLFNQNLSSGKEFIEKSLELFPGSPAANSIMAQITGDPIYQSRSKNNFFW